jgi:hypothetical protein
MHYEAIILDCDHGRHRQGIGSSPTQAVSSAARQDSDSDISADDVWESYGVTDPGDEMLENLQNLAEPLDSFKILIHRDRTREIMFKPVGFVRPVF